jgi:phenylacetate-coenzyme A ligase PaaK-like adenylate-forming protein
VTEAVDRTTGVLDPSESMSAAERRVRHDAVVRETLRLVWSGDSPYRTKLEAAGLGPSDDLGLDDLGRIPILRKDEPGSATVGLGSIPLRQARRIYVSPGPKFYASARRDDPPPERGKTPMALAFHAMGFRERDIVLNTFSYHLVPGGHGFDQQLATNGCAVIPAGPQNTDLQAQVLASLPVAGYVGTPTFLKLLCDKADALGISTKDDWSLEVAFVTAERLPESLREELEARTGARVRQIFGSADGLLPAYECWARSGMHLHPDQVLEVLDPETWEPVEAGIPGAVVATTAANPSRPLLRFANLDLVELRDDPCPCGRTGPRLARYVGRMDESTKVRGMFVYPNQIGEVLGRHAEVARWQAVVERAPNGTDDFTVRVELAGDEPPPPDLAERIAEGIRGLVRLRADIEVVRRGTIPEGAPALEDRRPTD